MLAKDEVAVFKRQMLGQWRVEDRDGSRHLPDETAFALMNDYRRDKNLVMLTTCDVVGKPRMVIVSRR